jgi:hypothetical protein
MRRAAPYVLFGTISLVCFWRFLFLGWTLYDVRTLQGHLGTSPAEAPGWFESNRPPVDRGDTILSLPMLNRLYSEGLHHGELRLWNPYLFCGYPLYNNLLVHPFYPPNLILHAILPSRIAYDLNLLLHFFFSGAAMFWLLRGIGRSDIAATAGGVMWMLLGYNTFWFSTGTFMGASVFAPLALLGIHRGLARGDLKPIGLGGMAMGFVILGSHGQHALHLLIFFSLWLLVCWFRDRDARRFILKGGALFIAAALGAGMAAILPQLDSVLNGLRIPGEDAQLHYAAPWTLPLYIVGVALGKVCYPPDGLLRSEFTIYAGVAGTLLAIAGAVRGFRDSWTRFLSIFALVALLVAFIQPLAALALLIPGLNLSMPARWVYVFGLCLTLLAAAGLDAMREDPARTMRVALVPGGLCLFAFAFYLSERAAIETLIGLGLAVGWVFSARRRPQLSLAYAFAALLFDLLPNFLLFNAHADPRPLEESIAAVQAVRARETEPWRATGSLRLAGGPPPANGWTIAIGSNLLALEGVEAVMGYESIAPLSTVGYCVETSGRKSVMGSGRVLAVLELDSRLMDVANMKYLFMPFSFTPGPRFRRIGVWGPLAVYENSEALPRARLLHSAVQSTSDNGAALFLRSKDFDPRTSVVLTTAQLPRFGAEDAGSVSWKSLGTDRSELVVRSKSDAILVVSDTDYPGWEAELDGKPTPIFRADLTFRAVAVPAGTHVVTMRFRPASARYGLILSALSMAGVLAFCGLRKKPSSRADRGILVP